MGRHHKPTPRRRPTGRVTATGTLSAAVIAIWLVGVLTAFTGPGSDPVFTKPAPNSDAKHVAAALPAAVTQLTHDEDAVTPLLTG